MEVRRSESVSARGVAAQDARAERATVRVAPTTGALADRADEREIAERHVRREAREAVRRKRIELRAAVLERAVRELGRGDVRAIRDDARLDGIEHARLAARRRAHLDLGGAPEAVRMRRAHAARERLEVRVVPVLLHARDVDLARGEVLDDARRALLDVRDEATREPRVVGTDVHLRRRRTGDDERRDHEHEGRVTNQGHPEVCRDQASHAP